MVRFRSGSTADIVGSGLSSRRRGHCVDACRAARCRWDRSRDGRAVELSLQFQREHQRQPDQRAPDAPGRTQSRELSEPVRTHQTLLIHQRPVLILLTRTVEPRVGAVRPEDRGMVDSFREHARVTDATRVHRSNPIANRKRRDALFEHAESIPGGFRRSQAEKRSCLRLIADERRIDPRLQPRRSALGRAPCRSPPLRPVVRASVRRS